MDLTLDRAALNPFPSHKLRSLETVAVQEGRFIGRVKSELCDPRDHVLLGLVIARRDGRPEAFLPSGEIRRLGPHAVTVDSRNDLCRLEEHARAREIVDEGIMLQGAPVVALDGERLGTLRSVWLDRHGNVANYQVSVGSLGFVRPRDLAPNEIVVIGPDAVIVQDSVRNRWRRPHHAASQE
jgi:uncharacterized protein YrrD